MPTYSQTRKESAFVLICGLVLVIIATFTIYQPGVQGPFVLDDFANLEPVFNLDLSQESWVNVVMSNQSGLLGRPISMLTFVFNHFTSGDVTSYKYTNIMLHLICGCLVFWLTSRLYMEAAVRKPWMLGLCASALWLMSPMLVSTTLYVVQRMTILSALFTYGGLLCYVIGRQSVNQGVRSGIWQVAVAYLLFFPLALFSKENGVLLPVLCLLIEAFFFGFSNGRARQALLTLHSLVVVLPAIIILTYILMHPGFILDGYSGRDFTPTERMLTQGRALAGYVAGSLFPAGSWLGLYHDDFVKSTSLVHPLTTLVAWAGWLVVLVAPWFNRAKLWRTFWFGPYFFLAGHALEASPLPLELYFEHRNYLPSAGLFFSVCLLASLLLARVNHKRLVLAGYMLITATYAGATYQRVQGWQSLENLLFTAYVSHPDSTRVNTDLASFYTSIGNTVQAIERLDHIDEVTGRRSSAVALQRLLVYCANKQEIPEKAYEYLEHVDAVDPSPSTGAALRHINDLIDSGSCTTLNRKRLLSELEIWLTPDSPHNAWRLNLETGRLYESVGNLALASLHYDRATAADPGRLEAEMIEFKMYAQRESWKAARRVLDDLMRRNTHSRPDFDKALSDYDAYLGNVEQAERSNSATAHSTE